MQYFDDLIIAGIKKNDNKTLAELYKVHYPMILNLILFNSGTEQEAKDIYQETIIAFYQRVHTENFKLTCKIKTYLYGVSRRLWLKKLTEKKLFVRKVDESETFEGIEEVMDEIGKKEEAFLAMEQSLKGLGEPCKTILEDFYLQSATMETIRDKFGYTNTDNAKNQKYKCLQRLKKSFFSDAKESLT